MPNKIPTPTKDSVFLCFDIESNGLHGPAFAVGALLMKADETIIDEFTARCPITGEVDEWVATNVLPSLKNMPEDQKDEKALRQAFWKWYKPAKQKADFTVVSNGYPVEARFLIACQEDDIEARYWDHPLPLLELNSLLFQIGAESRHGLVEDKIKVAEELKHNPRYDAWVSLLSTIKALQIAGRLEA